MGHTDECGVGGGRSFDKSVVPAEPVIHDPAHGFDNGPAAALPRGRTRVATLHVQVEGPDRADFTTNLQAVATIGGRPIDATVFLSRGTEP